MYKTTFIPTAQNNIIPFTIPQEWYGTEVECIVFPTWTEKTKKEKRKEDFIKLSGAWESDKSAEEMIAEIRDARKFKEKDLAL